jgi:branched-chain amino acid transport system ATP-binding protein
VGMLEARDIHVRFGDRVVLEDISFAVEPGEMHGIMGPNGAGKTTFFNVLTGRVKPSRGEVRIEGEDVTGLLSHKIAARGIARSFQTMTLFDEYTALENVVLALPEVRDRGLRMLHDLGRDSAAQDEAAAVLARVGLKGREHVPARDLPYGQRRALEIGIALGARPRLLFLDEPTSGLGAEATARLAELIAELKRGVTVVVIEHDMRFLFGLADRIDVIHWGQVIARGTPAELRANKWVQASNLGALASAP